MNRFAFFSSTINDSMFFSKINKGESIQSKIASIDETMIFFMNCFSKFDNIVAIVAIKYNYTFEVANSMLSKSYIPSIASLFATVT